MTIDQQIEQMKKMVNGKSAMKVQEWNLFDAKEDAKTGEVIMYYSNGYGRVLGFSAHPTKAFCFVADTLDGITPDQFRKLINAWLENAIGPKDSYYDRILSFNA